MNSQPHNIENPNSELARLLDRAARQPVELEQNGVRYRIMRVPATDTTVAARSGPYNRDRMIEAIYASAGALKDVDTDALLRALREDRAQDSDGRPAT